MDHLLIQPTEHTPRIDFDYTKKVLEFSGDSRPEDAQKFYTPILDWLKEYHNYLYFISAEMETFEPVTVNFKLEYFNSTTAKFLLDVFWSIRDANKDKLVYRVIWWYDEHDRDIKESGEEFEELAEMKFEFKVTE